MKRIETITILLLCLFAHLGIAQNIETNKQQQFSQGYWTLGLNGGIAYQTSDVKSNGGYGFGLTLAKNLYYQPGALLSFDVRGRLKYAQTEGLDTERSFDIDMNTALNGSQHNFDYTNYPASTGVTDGFVYQNYKNHLGELGLEGVIGFNKLAEERNILLNIYGGIGLDYYNTLNDQYNTITNTSYEEDYASLDPNQSTSSKKNLLESEILDGDYETQADGFDNDNGRLRFMPNLGFELGYQITPRVALGVGHKFTFSRVDNLDGNRWVDPVNDLHHYTNAFLKVKIKDGYVDRNPPKVIITNPPYTPYTTDKEVINILATVKHVRSSVDIRFRVNGRDQQFNYYDEILNADIRLRPGKNYIKIDAHNLDGDATDEVIINFEQIVVQNNAPHCNWTSPSKNNTKTSKAIYAAAAKVDYVGSREDITLKINGQRTEDFRFKHGNLEVNAPLRDGVNTLDLEVVNPYGRDRDVIEIVKQREVQLPTVDFSRPQDNYQTEDNRVEVIAKVRNVSHKGDIDLKVNGSRVYNFDFNNNTVTSAVNLQDGTNKIYIQVNNNDGQDDDNLTIIRNDRPVIQRPTVNITNFKVTGSNANECEARLDAQMSAVNSKNEIQVRLNGQRFYDFNFDRKTQRLIASMAIRSGQNEVEISVQNEGGQDSDRESTRCTLNVPDGPNVSFVDPSAQAETVSVDYKNIKVRVENVTSKNQISLRVNGSSRSFNYNTSSRLLTARVNLVAGNNTVRVSADNGYGQAEDQRNITYLKEILPVVPPVVTILTPNNNFTTEESSVAVNARVKGVTNRNDIRIKVNGEKVTSYIFNSLSGNINFGATLVPGNNTIWIEARNDDGTDNDQINVIYEKVNAPTVKITSPKTKERYSVPNATMKAKVTNVTSKNQITVKVNNKNVGFSFNNFTGVVTADLTLKEGSNVVVVKANTQGGTAEDNIVIYYDRLAKPTVDITSPKNNTTVKKAGLKVYATIKNVDNKSGVELKVNGKVKGFSYSNGKLNATVALSEGKNTIIVKGTNDSGNATDQVIVLYAKKKVLPIVTYTNPKKKGTQVKMTKFDLMATIQNVSKSADIKVYLNNVKINKFNFSTKTNKLSARMTLKTGKNQLKIVASNTDGSVTELSDVFVKPLISVPNLSKPTVKIVSISIPVQNPFDPTVLKSSVIAEVTNVANKGEITMLINGNAVSDFTYDANLKMVRYTFQLIDGVNQVKITVANKGGTDSDEGTVGEE